MTTLIKMSSLPLEIRNDLSNYKEYLYIGRPSKWGNPYSHKQDTIADYKVKTTKEALELYEKYLFESGLINHIEELKDKILVCWCINTKFWDEKSLKCHGQILLKYVNNKQLF